MVKWNEPLPSLQLPQWANNALAFGVLSLFVGAGGLFVWLAARSFVEDRDGNRVRRVPWEMARLGESLAKSLVLSPETTYPDPPSVSGPYMVYFRGGERLHTRYPRKKRGGPGNVLNEPATDYAASIRTLVVVDSVLRETAQYGENRRLEPGTQHWRREFEARSFALHAYLIDLRTNEVTGFLQIEPNTLPDKMTFRSGERRPEIVERSPSDALFAQLHHLHSEWEASNPQS